MNAGADRGDSVSTNYGVFYAGAIQYLSGFCGVNVNTIAKCYSTERVTAGGPYPCGDQELTQELSGFAFGGDISNSFWDVENSELTESSGGGSGITTAEMQSELTFSAAGWDFSEVWQMNGYPSLDHLDGHLGFYAWATACPAGQRGFSDSPSGDGISNLMKYVLGLSPLDWHSTADLFDVAFNSDVDALIVRYDVSKDAMGVDVTHEQTSSLMSPDWSGDGIERVKVGESTTHETWEARLPGVRQHRLPEDMSALRLAHEYCEQEHAALQAGPHRRGPT